jgi:GxxExxY protein
MVDLTYKEEVYAIVGAAMEVHNCMGCGFLEPVYQEAMEVEQIERGIPAFPQRDLPIYYKGRPLKKRYIADFVVFDKIIVEIKALSRLTSLEEAQVLNYLKASGLELGLLINFGAESLEWRRIIWTRQRLSSPSRNPPHTKPKE